MSVEPTLTELPGSIVVLTTPEGTSVRYIVDHVTERNVYLSYVLRGRERSPMRVAVGDPIELGVGHGLGWVLARGEAVSGDATASLVVRVDEVFLVQRREAYREAIELAVAIEPEPEPVAEATAEQRVGAPAFDSDTEWEPELDSAWRRGRTMNLSVGGFAAVMEGSPFPDGSAVRVRLLMPEGEPLLVRARKLRGDVPQRFAFVELARIDQERLARLVRTEELARRRDRTAEGPTV